MTLNELRPSQTSAGRRGLDVVCGQDVLDYASADLSDVQFAEFAQYTGVPPSGLTDDPDDQGTDLLRGSAAPQRPGLNLPSTLLTNLPEDYQYKVVFMRRALQEVVASQRKMLERSGKKGAALPDAALMKVFQGQLDKVDAWLKTQSNIQILDVQHRSLIQDPDPVVQAVSAFLGGGLDTQAMAAVIDPSLYRNRA